MKFKYETHLHTAPASACAREPGPEYARMYKELGYAGVMVTDHFFGGNTGIDRALPWHEFVDRFCAGYEAVLSEGEKVGIDVFFGWEQNFEGDEYLVYGLDKKWLKAHPEMLRWTRKEQFEQVEAAGGCVIQAHPFRVRAYITQINLSAGCVHGVEVCNTGNQPEADALAFRYAANLDLFMSAGSDIHSAGGDKALAAIAFDSRLNGVEDFVKAVKENAGHELVLPEGRCEWTEGTAPAATVCLRGRNDVPTGGLEELLRPV